MNTSKIFSMIALILLLSVAKAPAQDEDAFKQMFQHYGYEYVGVDNDSINGVDTVDVAFKDDDDNAIILRVAEKPILDFSDATFEQLNEIMDGKVLQFEKFNVKNQDTKATALVLDKGDNSVIWNIGFLKIANGDTTIYITIMGYGKKAKVMKEFREILESMK